jgi:hypothetical protein
MAKKATIEDQEEVVTEEAVEETTAPKSEKKVKKTSFDVYNSGGSLVRTYSVEQHKGEAEALAKEYAKKIGGDVK